MRILILASLIVFFTGYMVTGQQGQYENISESQMEKLLLADSVKVIDIRTAAEVRQGYISGTEIFIDFYSNNWEEEIGKLDKNYQYIVYCRSGARSSSAASKMASAGFNQVYNLRGGIIGWRNKSKIVTR